MYFRKLIMRRCKGDIFEGRLRQQYFLKSACIAGDVLKSAHDSLADASKMEHRNWTRVIRVYQQESILTQ